MPNSFKGSRKSPKHLRSGIYRKSTKNKTIKGKFLKKKKLIDL